MQGKAIWSEFATILGEGKKRVLGADICKGGLCQMRKMIAVLLYLSIYYSQKNKFMKNEHQKKSHIGSLLIRYVMKWFYAAVRTG